jgi:hypothetical protein
VVSAAALVAVVAAVIDAAPVAVVAAVMGAAPVAVVVAVTSAAPVSPLRVLVVAMSALSAALAGAVVVA